VYLTSEVNDAHAATTKLAIDRVSACECKLKREKERVGAAWGLLPPDEAWPKAEAAIAKALVLDDRLAEAHTGLAALKLVFYRDWPGAERAARRAIALNPGFDEIHYLYSFYLLAAGRFDDAVAEARRALSIDPFSPRLNEFLGKCLYFGGRYDEAIRQYRHTLEFDAGNAAVHEALGDACEQNGAAVEAIDAWSTAMIVTGDTALATCLDGAAAASGIAGAVRAVAEMRLLRLDAQAAAGRYLPAAAFACLHARAGDDARALDAVARACNERNVFALLIAHDPVYAALGDDPRFARAIAHVSPARPAATAT